MTTPIERKSIPLEISCVVPGEYVHFDAHLVRVELRKLFIAKVPDEEMFDWIEKHIGCKTNTKTFIRTLTTALIESLLEKEYGDSYETVENFTRKLKRKAKLMLKYTKYEQDLEVACISALQTLCAQYQHPPGMLRKAYRALCDTEVLIDDSFFEWEKSEDSEDQPGKDVCLTCVKFFLNWLRNIGL
ncbi:Eukaryotic translation initiation factor 4 gamma 3 [Armadillidium nasatum]|uniref:Eukaryotic translation initiation factor 4 gamma 3 n=1 Tax=Armadillidium nasatum TaxID=96803 RepID=A0A5N5T6T4_9CRUS|nr:Eukaryotic translation initiation factor 4 gamma 3 [Armadillidium nasatum]